MKKKIIIISGFSAVGKDTLIRELLKKNRDIALVKSCTTRKPRSDDNGKYTYLSKIDFDVMLTRGGFLEYNIYGNEHYGTPLEGANGVNSVLKKADTVLIEVDYHGMKNICESGYFDKEEYDIITVFIAASSDTLIHRLMKRNTETLQQVKHRLETALSEVNHVNEYAHIVLNDSIIEYAVKDLEDIICGKPVENPVFFEKYFEKGIRGYIEKLEL